MLPIANCSVPACQGLLTNGSLLHILSRARNYYQVPGTVSTTIKFCRLVVVFRPFFFHPAACVKSTVVVVPLSSPSFRVANPTTRKCLPLSSHTSIVQALEAHLNLITSSLLCCTQRTRILRLLAYPWRRTSIQSASTSKTTLHCFVITIIINNIMFVVYLHPESHASFT